MRLYSCLDRSTGPWAELNKEEQLRLTRHWRDPFWVNAAGVVVYQRNENEDDLLNTRVMVSTNRTADMLRAKQIHFGGFMDPRKDFCGPRFTALRELWEETGLCPQGWTLKDLPSLSEITTLHAPTMSSVQIEGTAVHLHNAPNGKNAYKHPHSISLFATDALLEQKGKPDGEVTGVEWSTLKNVIAQYGSDPEFCYPAVVFGLLWWLKTGIRFEYSNWPGESVSLDLNSA